MTFGFMYKFCLDSVLPFKALLSINSLCLSCVSDIFKHSSYTGVYIKYLFS